MKPKLQKPIYFYNACNCLVDYAVLEKANVWYSKDVVFSKRKIYLHGNYPCVSIFDEKLHVHRLILSFTLQRKLDNNEYVHHIDHNKLNCSINNLELMSVSAHQSLHNKGKFLSPEHKSKISDKNKLRKGTKHKKGRSDVTSKMVYDLKIKGMSFNKISNELKLDFKCTKQRYNDFIHDNPELIK